MAHSYIEIANDSRKMKVTNSGMSQDFTVDFILDGELPIEVPLLQQGDYEFLGDSDDVIALSYSYSVFPLFRYLPNYDLDKKVLVLKDISLSQKGPRHWRATAQYTFDINKGSGGSRASSADDEQTLPYIKLNFNIGGGTKRITKSILVKEVDIRDGTELDVVSSAIDKANMGAIGVTEDTIEGTDVPTSDLRVQITVYYLPDFITMDFMKVIRDTIAGKDNRGTYAEGEFLDCEEGEVQLRAASGGGVVVDIIPITFDFHIGKNIDDQEDDGFSNLTMLGHDLLDYLFIKEWDGDIKKMLLKPSIRVIHQIATPTDYSVLRLPI